MTSDQLPNRLVSRPELKAMFGVSYSNMHLIRLEKAGKFPQRVRLSINRVAWYASEVQAWVNARGAERPTTIAA